MANITKSFERVYVPDREAWRAWLASNHATSPGVWLIRHKKHSKAPCPSYDEAVEEGLCYGWIDSLANRLDDERFLLLFTPRKPKSGWSKLNKQRIAQLVRSGRMTPIGKAKIDAAKKDGSWTRLDAIEHLTMPPDLERALARHAAARQNFAAFSESYRKRILWWIESAKSPETRQKRVRHTVHLAAQRRKPGFPNQKPAAR